MAIIATRIDGRLVHGQVANLWTTKLQATRIMVVDDKVSQSQIEKSGLRMATPAGVRLSVLDVDTAADHILNHKYDSQRVFIVAKGPAPLLALINKGVGIDSINVGNMSQTDDTKHITKSINVLDSDVADFKELQSKGVKLTAQMVPGDESQDFMSLLKKGLGGEA
ncbi:PTS system mannose/fructose/N-acetylgalactosamine-transporter subunit IIB [uncultured Lacticaseibacillus sp.]|jgi:PTS system mannose-specific IIB component|uniref:PTS system mannose/fructose/N-acetylgalactosamine-transporter subunit IIB n=1 Tax=uncultured Lacticaseibacillus sp. TaxID=2775882 RepID=UPI0025973F08|nr:PTS sugar transporter subunit IIB [uncultured Lacticaseibacillus sp.]